jgi:hypothetical protein
MGSESSDKILSKMFEGLFFHDLGSVSEDFFAEMGENEFLAFEGDSFGNLFFKVTSGEESEL